MFGESRVYCGGFTAQQVIHLLHGFKLPKSVEVVPGCFLGGEAAAVEQVAAGTQPLSAFKFFAGAVAWAPGQLAQEVADGAWYTAAASRPLLLKQCLQLPKPLWRELLELMGGEYAEAARASYKEEGDE